jgi:hypothetical protein
MSFTPFVIAWAAMALCTAMLVVWRTVLGFNEDDSLHLSAGTRSMDQQQITKAHRIEAVEHWEKILSIVTAVYGAVLLGAFMYRQLN